MKRTLICILILSVSACAHLPGRTTADGRARVELWHEAHVALYQQNFARADSLFERLAAQHRGSDEGREALFYVGSVNLDPRNADWNSERAETAFQTYLQLDTVGSLIHRRPEATTMLEIARQLNLPPGERIAALQPGTVVTDTIVQLQPRIASQDQLRELQQENERLRGQVERRDEQIRQQREELERIRRALQPRPPPE